MLCRENPGGPAVSSSPASSAFTGPPKERPFSEWDAKKPGPVRLIATGAAGPPALHAGALERQLFTHVVLRDSPTSWLPPVRDPTQDGQLVDAVHGALRAYDLADLASSLPRESITVEEARKK